MKYGIRFRPRAEADLIELYDYIAERSGANAAHGYVGRIRHACMDLSTFPKRGTARDDIRKGLRVLRFERRVLIVFEVRKAIVVIARILYGGRDYERLLRSP
ncbi:MAG: type II toxin-antitoxin system RelE/ParE family toxin [Alphaproteobacteria bacterium]